ncbi:MAG: acetyl-CoA carboxylase biotin carboxyl carrier protein [Pyrinomonadaceae bacterium]
MSDQDATPPPVSGDERSRENQNQTEQPRGGRSERERHSRRRHQQNQPRRASSESMLPMEELRDLVELIGEHGFTDFEFERQDFRVRLRRELAPQIIAAPPAPASPITMLPQTAAAPMPSPPAAVGTVTPPPQGAQPEAKATEEENLHIITSPIVGTFYRSASPTTEPFVRIGDHVSPETTVCIIEAMKLMNEIQAETSGEVVKIYVENAQPVEYGQPLFGIRK